MKKIIALLIIIANIICLNGCGVSKDENSESSKTESSSKVSNTDTEESKKQSSKEQSENDSVGKLLESSFDKILKNNTYYIDVKMTVELFGGKEESNENSDSDNTLMVYNYTVALDSEKAVAGIKMSNPDGSSNHCVVKNNKSYNIDTEAKKYTVSYYPESETYFAGQYTTDIYLGTTDYLKLEDSGTTTYKGLSGQESVNVEFEKYKTTKSDGNGANVPKDTEVTYYFKENKPYAEIIKTPNGQTTFEFREVSETILDDDIFYVPSDFLEVSSNTSSNSLPSQNTAEEPILHTT